MAAESQTSQERLIPGAPTVSGSAVHQLAPQVKLVALVTFVCCVVATPVAVVWPYLAQLVVVLVVVALAGLKLGRLLRGLAVEVPFVAFAFAMPFLATGPTVPVFGLQLSISGLWGAWTLLAKSTVSVLAALTLAATTAPQEFVGGLQQLRFPALLVEILSFMVRYLDVILGEWRRMAIARTSRGFQARNPRSWSALSGAVGSGFIRSYERGERVHLAMLSRGYCGELPAALGAAQAAPAAQWLLAAALPMASLTITLAAWSLA